MEKDFSIDGLRVHCDVTGPESGSPVILMHGWGCDHTTVRSIAAVLEKKYRVFSLDLPGHGKSDEPQTVWGVDDYTCLVEKLIRAENLKHPALIGHSFGGRISILLSSRSDDVSKVMLVDAAGVKPKRPLKYYLKVYSFKAGKRLMPLLLGRKRGEQWIENRRKRSGSADYRQASPMMRAILSKCVNEDLTAVMPQIKAPTLLVWGENDTATPMRDARIMEKLIPDAGLVSFPGCGHYSFLDNAAQFRAVTKSFFEIN